IIAEETAVQSRPAPSTGSSLAYCHNHRLCERSKDGVWVSVIGPSRYDCAINIEDLIKLSDVMNEHSLGPNGDHYFLFDFPGQVELFFLHSNAKKVIMKLIKKLDLQLTMIHLIDSHLCSDPGKYVSALLLTLSTMLHMEVPHVNVLSKMDLIESYGKLEPSRSRIPARLSIRKLTKELCEDKESVTNLVKLIDKTNGYIFQGIDASAVEFSKIAIASTDWEYYRYPFIKAKNEILHDDNSTQQRAKRNIESG
ncbi:GPN-loop GTPase 2, partial [Tanacetum coccineum]